eukprot:4302589-Pleurochrysis_carterae.AAC.1
MIAVRCVRTGGVDRCGRCNRCTCSSCRRCYRASAANADSSLTRAEHPAMIRGSACVFACRRARRRSAPLAQNTSSLLLTLVAASAAAAVPTPMPKPMPVERRRAFVTSSLCASVRVRFSP